MDHIFVTGLLGSLVTLAGAAWKDHVKVKHPLQSKKNWLFAIGALIMCLYAFFGWQEGGPFFYVILEIMLLIASALMMSNISDKISSPVILLSGLGLVIWSLFLFEDYSTVLFILGLCGVGLGFVFKMGTRRRDLALTIGSAMIAIFSYIEASWIFFWLNVFFALFAGYYLIRGLKPSDA